MSQENYITLRGFVTGEPKFRQTTQLRVPVTEIRVGSTPRRLNRETGEWQDLQTSYYTVKCWRRLALNVMGSLHKGDMIVVRGKFYLNAWVDKETQRPRTALEIEADSIGHDLAYGHSIFTRSGRPQPGSAAGLNAGELARQDMEPADGDGRDDDDASYEDPAASFPAGGEWSDDGSLPSAEPDAAAAEPVAVGLADDYGSNDMAAVPF